MKPAQVYSAENGTEELGPWMPFELRVHTLQRHVTFTLSKLGDSTNRDDARQARD